MFAADLLGELDFELEFNLPKEISDNQDHIKLSVNRVEVPAVEIPVCPIGYKSRPIRTPGEIHCIERYTKERYKCIKPILQSINKWVNSIYCACNKLHSNKSSLYVEAKLYAYKKDHSLFKKWGLVDFAPLFNQDVMYTTDDIELIFKFENIVEVDDKPMYDISKYIKEYKDRENNCEYCAYYHIQGGRCGLCSSYDWFVQEINLKQYIIKRVTEDSGKDFEESDEAIRLKTKADLRKSVYDDFNKYVEKQKEILDQELEDKRKEWSDLQSEYAYKVASYISDNIDKALSSLDSMKV
jgi:hypothetical protein